MSQDDVTILINGKNKADKVFGAVGQQAGALKRQLESLGSTPFTIPGFQTFQTTVGEVRGSIDLMKQSFEGGLALGKWISGAKSFADQLERARKESDAIDNKVRETINYLDSKRRQEIELFGGNDRQKLELLEEELRKMENTLGIERKRVSDAKVRLDELKSGGTHGSLAVMLGMNHEEIGEEEREIKAARKARDEQQKKVNALRDEIKLKKRLMEQEHKRHFEEIQARNSEIDAINRNKREEQAKIAAKKKAEEVEKAIAKTIKEQEQLAKKSAAQSEKIAETRQQLAKEQEKERQKGLGQVGELTATVSRTLSRARPEQNPVIKQNETIIKLQKQIAKQQSQLNELKHLETIAENTKQKLQGGAV